MRILTLLVIVLTAGAATARGQPSPPREATPPPPRVVSGSKPSAPRGKTPITGQISIADRAPDFVLDGSLGHPVKLSTLRGQWVLLAFADRYRTLAPLDSITSAAERLQARVVVVCHEKQQTLMSLGARDKIRMLMLADATGEVSAVYGLYDWRQGETEPGFFVLDPEGVVRLAVLGRLFPPQTMFEFLRYSTGDWESSSRSP